MYDRQWASIAVNTCVTAGVDHFFLAPGSRCTPLTLAVARHSQLTVTRHFDERGLAFAALGYARATGRPGVFVCTSGTAVANAFPAVIEASMEGIPMLVWTADRPSELRGTGANQTIDQQWIFGDYPRWFFDVPCPTESLEPRFVQSIVDRALAESKNGPAHLNWMFREPFCFDEGPCPVTRAEPTENEFASESKQGSKITCTGETVLLAGGCSPREARVIQRFAAEHELPLVTDITSGLRGIPPDLANVLPPPKTIVQFGGRIVSKSWHPWTASLPATRFIHITPRGIHLNPHHLSQERYVEPIDGIRLNPVKPNTKAFNAAWCTASAKYRDSVEQVLHEHRRQTKAVHTEPELAHVVGSRILDGHAIFIGNSMPIRDFDRCAFWPTTKDVVIGANRGASGIDGLIATSFGFAAGLGRPTTAVLGDLSSLHDLNSLALLAKSAQPITLVIVNNQAGGIFDMLPVARCQEHFEQYFATPHAFDFMHAADMFGLPYVCLPGIDDSANVEFPTVYEKAIHGSRSGIIEVKTDRTANQSIRQRIQELFHK